MKQISRVCHHGVSDHFKIVVWLWEGILFVIIVNVRRATVVLDQKCPPDIQRMLEKVLPRIIELKHKKIACWPITQKVRRNP